MASASSQGVSSLQGSSARAGPWDTPFNRAMNKVKKVDPLSKKPSSAGRVVGFGGSTNWSEYYGKEDTRTRKARKTEEADNSAYVRGLEEKVNQIPQIVQDEVAKTMTSLLPTLLESLGNWHAGGRQGPCPIPSMVSSHSGTNAAPVTNVPAVLVTPAAITAAAPDVVTPQATIAQPKLNAPAGS